MLYLIGLLILGSISTLTVAVLIAPGAFLIELRRHINALLYADDAPLKLEVSETRVAWVLNPNLTPKLPYYPLIFSAIAGAAAAVVDTLVVASHSEVPTFWYTSGAIAAAIALLIPFVAAWLFQKPLHRSIGRALMRRVNKKKEFADDILLEIYGLIQEIDDCYAFLGLRAKTDYMRYCRWQLFQPGLGNDAVRSQLIAIKRKAKYDLRSVLFLAALFADARTALEQAKVSLQDKQHKQDIERIEKLLYSQALADALQEARWQEASDTLKNVNADLARLLGRTDELGMPRSKQEARRVLNVSDETPLEHIKAVVRAYWRVWHPDLARDDIEREQYQLRTQQINVAWTFLQKDALKDQSEIDATEQDNAR